MNDLNSISLLLLCIGLNTSYADTMGAAVDYDFTGAYIGVGSGFISSFVKDTFSTQRSDGSAVSSGNPINRYTYTSILFNGDVGYGKMMNENVYLGVKGSIYYTPLETSDETGFSSPFSSLVLVTGTSSTTSRLSPIYNIDAVLGYEVIPHFLPFVEGGVSFTNFKRNYEMQRTRTLTVASGLSAEYESSIKLDGYKTTYNVGVGLNYQLHPSWLLGTELVYNYLGKHSGVSNVTIPTSSVIETYSHQVSSQAVSMFLTVSYLSNLG